MGVKVDIKIDGLAETRAAFLELAPKLRRTGLTAALKKGAAVVRNEARLRAPLLKASTYYGASAIRRGIRTVGTLRKAISVRTSQRDKEDGNVGVFVNVRPAKKGQAGAKSPTDPFYWRWQEFGWNPATRATTKAQRRRANRRLVAFGKQDSRNKTGGAFLRAGASKLPQALPIIVRELGPIIRKLNQKKATKR